MKWFKKKTEDQQIVLNKMDGREIKYVTRRVRSDDGGVKEVILGKTGRIVVIENEIRVMCGEKDVFRCNTDNAVYYMLLSGDGMTVSGTDVLSGENMDIIVYFTYYRK